MRINPPKAVINSENPFKNALFGRVIFAQSLTNLLQNVYENTVVFVNAPWGEGKTTFAQMWRASLLKQNREVIYFDAYAADYFDDPFVSFSGEILELVDKRLSGGKGLIERQEFKETAAEVGKRFASLAVKVGLRAVTLNLIQSSDIEELKEIGEDIANGLSEVGADTVEKEIENHALEKDELKKFKESLAKLAAKVRQEQGFPLTIIVDELDRCRPDFALGLLERIKHLFDVEGVAFVLLVNMKQIEGYIHNVYGNSDEEAYLQKFGSFFVDLPRQEQSSNFEYEPGRKAYCQELFNHYEISKRMQDSQLAIITGALAVHFDLTLREIEKVFTVMSIYYASLTNTEFSNPFLVSLLSILKVKRPSIYKRLIKNNILYSQFVSETDFDKVEIDSIRGIDLEWAKSLMRYCLLSEPDFSMAKRDKPGLDGMANWVRGNRTLAIPDICQQLDRFSLRLATERTN